MTQLDDMFDQITSFAIETYNYKQVLLVVPLDRIAIYETIRMCDEQGVNCWPNFGGSLFYHAERTAIADNMNKFDSKQVLLVNSPTILSDAFASQVWIAQEHDFKPVKFPTFGASPDRIAVRCFGVSDSIGSLSEKVLDNLLNKNEDDWTLNEIKEVISEIGGSWTRARLREVYEAGQN